MENSKLNGRTPGEFSVKHIGEPVLVSPAEETKKGLYFLSNIDHNIMNIVKTVYCYGAEKEGKDSLRNPVEVIRNSLEKVLVHYYPLAGRLIVSPDGKIMVDCDNPGVIFVEAEADCTLEEIGVISPEYSKTLKKLVYDVPGVTNILEMPPLVVQVTNFKCGGFVLGLCILHCMTDGIAAVEFVNLWGEIARGMHPTTLPFLDRTILKARDPPQVEYDHKEYIEIEDYKSGAMGDILQEKDETLCRSFCFDHAKLERLKAIAAEDGALGQCSTFKALAAFVWQARTKALSFPPENRARLLIPVDGRSKITPPIPRGFFGNGIMLANSICPAQKILTCPLSHAVELVRGAVRTASGEYMRSQIDCFEATRPHLNLAGSVLISNWSMLQFQTADFGWGKPVDFGPVVMYDNIVLFLSDMKEKKNINVVFQLPIRAMEVFEQLIKQI